jgi:hypothetical protein
MRAENCVGRQIKELPFGINRHPLAWAQETLLRNQGDEIYLERKFSFADVPVAAIFR